MSESIKEKAKISDLFECQKCGHCCHGETTVSLDADDQQRMILSLGMYEEEVREKYWRVNGSVVQMKTKDGHCIFYNKNIGCMVHTGRPWRCCQWPLHPSILTDEINFETIRNSCPGINKNLKYEEFRSILQRIIDEQEEYTY